VTRMTWTIGSGGLIGSAVTRLADNAFHGSLVPWKDSEAAGEVLRATLRNFEQECRATEAPWALVWAAGAATVSATEQEAAREAALFRSFARDLASSNLPPDGVIVLVSSAGGVHAGSLVPPFDETTPPAPISPYGRARLAQEEAAAELLGQRWPVVLARVSNVYGPGQDLTKLQGLISRLALCSLTREPLNLFVPLSTVRDYIYVDDVARLIHAWIAEEAATPAAARVRILASGQGTSIGQLVRAAQDVGHRKVPIAMGTHPSASSQAPDLRFVPSRPETADLLSSTTIPVGMKRVFDDLLRRLEDADA
jgi:UDP-glucose 4-epimerase